MRQSLDKKQQAPPPQGRGKGWGLSVEQIDLLHERARQMRRNPTEPEKRLWRHLSGGQLGGFKFRRQEVIGGFIADFPCPRLGIVIEIDGDTHVEPAADARRETAMARHGYRTVRFTNAEVMGDMEGVLTALLEECRRTLVRRSNPHPNPSPEGEGLDAVEAQKLLGISLEGSVG